jgi:hypothetical protein
MRRFVKEEKTLGTLDEETETSGSRIAEQSLSRRPSRGWAGGVTEETGPRAELSKVQETQETTHFQDSADTKQELPR